MKTFPAHIEGLSREQVSKLGNTIIYLSKEIKDLNKTKILKILFLIEEASIKKYGTPFFNITFQIWQHGPVAKDIFIDLSEEAPVILSEYIKKSSENNSIFEAISAFNDDEFSDNDIELLDIIINHTKEKSATKLVKIAHEPNTLWYKSAVKFGVLDKFESGTLTSSNFEIDFDMLFEDDEVMLERYHSAIETRQVINSLKGQ